MITTGLFFSERAFEQRFVGVGDRPINLWQNQPLQLAVTVSHYKFPSVNPVLPQISTLIRARMKILLCSCYLAPKSDFLGSVNYFDNSLTGVCHNVSGFAKLRYKV